MKLSYLPGDNPANVHQIRLFAGGESVENVFITRAMRKQGKLTLEVEILDCEINREIERNLSAEIHEEPGITPDRTNNDSDQTPEPGGTGVALKRHTVPAKRSGNRDSGKDQA